MTTDIDDEGFTVFHQSAGAFAGTGAGGVVRGAQEASAIHPPCEACGHPITDRLTYWLNDAPYHGACLPQPCGPLGEPEPPSLDVVEAARVILDAWNLGIGGDKAADKDAFQRLILGASFGAAAFDRATPDDAKPAAMIWALLQAIVDPTADSLDYLRACNAKAAGE